MDTQTERDIINALRKMAPKSESSIHWDDEDRNAAKIQDRAHTLADKLAAMDRFDGIDLVDLVDTASEYVCK